MYIPVSYTHLGYTPTTSPHCKLCFVGADTKKLILMREYRSPVKMLRSCTNTRCAMQRILYAITWMKVTDANQCGNDILNGLYEQRYKLREYTF